MSFSSSSTPYTLTGGNSLDRVDSQASLVTSNDDYEEESSSEEEESLAGSLSTQDAIDMSDGNMLGPERLLDLAQQMSEFAVTTLTLSNNGFVDLDEKQEYNDDSFCNRGILAFSKALKKHTTITNLDISQNNLGVRGQSGLVALAEAVCSGVVQTLDVSSNTILGLKGMRFDFMKALSTSLKTSSGSNLKDLRCTQNAINATAVTFVGVALVDSPLEHLDLSENAIGVDSMGRRSASGINSMTMSFASDKCRLVTLNLSENFLGNEECILISSVLEVMRPLKELDISFNDVHALGARHLADALKYNDTLVHLNLGGNHVQDQGCGDISDALRDNETLTSLVLAANDLTTSSCYYWQECLGTNRTLTDLNIEENENMEESEIREVMEWTHANTDLIALRSDPDNYDLAVKSRVCRDSLFNKVGREEHEVIAKLVANVSIKNDAAMYEMVSKICPPDRGTMLRMTNNLLSLMTMTKEDKAIRLVQKAYRRLQERKRKEAELREKEARRRKMVKSKSKKSFGGSMKGMGEKAKSGKMVRAGNVRSVKGHTTGAASKNVVVR